MSVRSFHSVFMASAVAGAALGCYLVSLRVASERAALEAVESEIVLAQRDIRLLQTEIGTRARLAQLERWNVRVLALSAPSADQILGDKFQLARMIAPQHKPALEAPVILAAAPAQPSQPPLAPGSDGAPETAGDLLHEASVKMPAREPAVVKLAPVPAEESQPTVRSLHRAKSAPPKPRAPKPTVDSKTLADKGSKPASATVTKPVRTARADPLAPLPSAPSTIKASRTNR